MPQMDSAAFLPQVFWLVVVFFSFYIIVLKNILPVLSRILKVRAKKLSQGQDLLESMGNETNLIGADYDQILTKTTKESTDFLQKTSSNAGAWIEDSLDQTTGKSATSEKLTKMNDLYLQTVGEITGKKALLLKFSS